MNDKRYESTIQTKKNFERQKEKRKRKKKQNVTLSI